MGERDDKRSAGVKSNRKIIVFLNDFFLIFPASRREKKNQLGHTVTDDYRAVNVFICC